MPESTVSLQEEENTYTTTRGRSLNASIWATFLQSASANVGGEKAKDITEKYSMASGIETKYFEPTDDEVTARVQQSAKVSAAMDSGLFGQKQVYMITGLKIAKGFAYESSTSSSIAGNVGGSAPLTPGGEVSLGAEAGASSRKEMQTSYKTGPGIDIIFAYQVHEIATKGWREKSKRIEATVHRSKQAFLGQEEVDQSSGMQACAASKEMLEDEELERRDLKSVELADGDGHHCTCIIPIAEDEQR